MTFVKICIFFNLAVFIEIQLVFFSRLPLRTMDPDRNEDRKPAKTRERSPDSKVGCFGFLTINLLMQTHGNMESICSIKLKHF